MEQGLLCRLFLACFRLPLFDWGNFNIKLKDKMKEGLASTIKEVAQTLLVSFGIFLIVYIFLIQPHRVKGESMFPTFVDGELLLTEKVSYRFSQPQRGDVVVFEAPVGHNIDFIKRIIGLPGEQISVQDGSIFINGKKLDEPYLNVESPGDMQKTLGKNEYFVMGDNRPSSSDSRVFGPITEDKIQGRVFFVYWPIFRGKSSDGMRVISRVHY